MMDMDDDDDDLLLACSMEAEIPQLSQSTRKGVKKFVKVSSSLKSKAQDPWIASSFGDFEDFGKTSAPKASAKVQSKSTTQPRKKAKRTDTDVQQPSTSKPTQLLPSKKKPANYDLWADRHKPTCQGDLAVHKKKIQELQDWLQHSLGRKHKQAPILLLTGPAGAGKTATLNILSQELSIEVQEWSNPDVDDYNADSWNSTDFRPVGGSVYVSQTSQFQDFLLRANRYPSLQIFNQDTLHRKLILVEDFPNVFFRNTSSFHDIIRNYQQRGQCPLVFIVSDSAAGSSNERLLFPKDVQAELCISNISFNPVAPTSLVKVMTTIATHESSQSGNKLRVPNKTTLEALAAASSGDIRGAINALQFACLKDTQDLNDILSKTSQVPSLKKSSSSRSRKNAPSSSSTNLRKQSSAAKRKQGGQGEVELAAIGGRDTSLFLFRALGKILYCKRGDPADFPDTPSLPQHLAHHYRDPLLEHPEDVTEKAQLSAEFFTAYLHQNYLDFYGHIDDVVVASDYLSDVDYLTTDWSNRSALRDYAGSVAARSLMFCNSARATSSGGGSSGLGWKPLHKPQWFEINRKIHRNKESSRDLFRIYGWTPEELHMNFLPYVSLTRVHLKGPGQMSYVQENNKYGGKQLLRGQSERLDENDVGFVDSDDETSSLSQTLRPADIDSHTSASQSHTDNTVLSAAPQEKDEEEFVIDDFDD